MWRKASSVDADLLREGEAVFEEMRSELESQVGAGALADAEDVLRALVGENVIRLHAPGWSGGEAGSDAD
ncbi:hypothetical protein ACFJGV_11115 [Cnuibacter sp. UC19_7]|uniref:hypothetical protein n=1 Tax=Cnuibacter sp. UC19_7 TaxID=3350166 RepID=UPI00366D24E0